MNMKRFLVVALALSTLAVTPAKAQAPVQLCVPTKSGIGQSCSFGLNNSLKSALLASVQTIKSTSGVLGSFQCYNPSNAAAYVQIFDVAGSVTLGTTVPTLSFGMTTLTNSGLSFTNGLLFANAIKVAATTTATGLTAPSAALTCNFGYK